MKGFSKLIKFLSNDYGDDIGRGKSKVAKQRHKHTLRTRLRRLLKKEINDDTWN